MKTTYLQICLIGLLLFSNGTGAQIIPDDLLILTDDYPPFVFEENGTVQGITVDLFEKAFQQIDPTFTRESIKIMDWEDAVNQTLTRNNTLLIATSRTPEREDHFLWIGPLATDFKGLFGLKSKSPSGQLDISDKRIVIDDNPTYYRLALDAGASKDKITIVSSQEEAIRMIENETADLWGYSLFVGEHDIKAYATNPEEITQQMILAQTDMYVAGNLNTSPEFVHDINETLKEIRNSKTETGVSVYEQILDKYLSVQCKETSLPPQDVTDLVNLTADAIKINSDETLKQINAGVAPYIDAENPDLYVFVYDLNTTLLADGVNPKLIGQNMAGKEDVFGKAFRDEIVSGALANGSGYVTYVFTSPFTSGMFFKTTYYHLVTGSDDNKYIVCSGRYLTCDEKNTEKNQ
jgi:polar amino acid transport system substrate-binding protein